MKPQKSETFFIPTYSTLIFRRWEEVSGKKYDKIATAELRLLDEVEQLKVSFLIKFLFSPNPPVNETMLLHFLRIENIPAIDDYRGV